MILYQWGFGLQSARWQITRVGRRYGFCLTVKRPVIVLPVDTELMADGTRLSTRSCYEYHLGYPDGERHLTWGHERLGYFCTGAEILAGLDDSTPEEALICYAEIGNRGAFIDDSLSVNAKLVASICLRTGRNTDYRAIIHGGPEGKLVAHPGVEGVVRQLCWRDGVFWEEHL